MKVYFALTPIPKDIIEQEGYYELDPHFSQAREVIYGLVMDETFQDTSFLVWNINYMTAFENIIANSRLVEPVSHVPVYSGQIKLYTIFWDGVELTTSLAIDQDGEFMSDLIENELTKDYMEVMFNPVDSIMLPNVIAIVGGAGTGKSSVAKYLERIYQITPIVSYTTRPIREGEVDGVDYHYITQDELEKYCLKDMINLTVYGGYSYFGLRSDIKESGNYSYVVDEAGANELCKIPGIQVFPIEIITSPEILDLRGISKERQIRDKSRKPTYPVIYSKRLENNGTEEELFRSVDYLMNELRWS